MAALAGAAATVTVLAGCGSTAVKAVNPTKVAAAIKQSVQAQRHKSANVSCPSGVPVRKGAHFYCVAQVGAQITAFKVTETTAKGAVSYVGLAPGKGPLVNTGRIEQAIKHSISAKRKITAQVSCPQGIPRQQGLSFVCVASAKGERPADFVVRQIDGAGHIKFSS